MTIKSIENLVSVHTTELGVVDLKRNLKLEVVNVVLWCKIQIKNPTSSLHNQKST